MAGGVAVGQRVIINTCASNMKIILCVCVCALQLYRASALFETIRHEAQHSTDYKLSLFDLQTSSYQALQRVLVSLGINIPPLNLFKTLYVRERDRVGLKLSP